MFKKIEQPAFLLKNTLTGEKTVFAPLQNNHVGMYVCGITPYDFAHVGHGRCYVIFDVVYRLLKTFGYSVTYVRNFTDIDDKLLARAEKEYGDATRYKEVAQRFIDAYHEDMQRLGCCNPQHEPRVTEVIPEIIAFIEGLIKKGNAYESNGSVYFAVNTFCDYCKLSKRDINDLQAGARVEINDEKRNPLDFALWKAETGNDFWQSPWGHGRPGWHIECSVMAEKYLGAQIDIHGGGMDLIFPHHENELAQSEALHGHEFARFWLHNAFVRIDKEKMSKSLGNFFTLRQVFEKYDPMVVRYMILNHHYRSPLDFSFDDLDVSQKTYQRLCKLLHTTEPAASVDVGNPLVKSMMTFLCDDLNTPGMFGVLFENWDLLQKDEQARAAVKALLVNALGLTLIPLPEKEVEMTPEIESLLAQREQARKDRNWKLSDELRDQLKALGYEVRDTKAKS
jgi:cysteinyl-tRNA synthetase